MKNRYWNRGHNQGITTYEQQPYTNKKNSQQEMWVGMFNTRFNKHDFALSIGWDPNFSAPAQAPRYLGFNPARYVSKG